MFNDTTAITLPLIYGFGLGACNSRIFRFLKRSVTWGCTNQRTTEKFEKTKNCGETKLIAQSLPQGMTEIKRQVEALEIWCGLFCWICSKACWCSEPGFQKKDIKGVGDWCPGKLDVIFPFVHFWMVFAAGPWVLGVAHVWYRFAKLTPQPRVWCDLVGGPIIYQNAKLLIGKDSKILMRCNVLFISIFMYTYISILLYIYTCVELYDLCANYKIYKLRATWLMSYIVKN